MERGDLSGVSDSVLFALVRALQLDEAETAHLFDLTRAASGPRRELRAKPETRVSPLIAQLLDTMRDVPALAMNRVTTPVGSNALGRALFPHLFPADAEPLNSARTLFLDERSKDFYPDWETSAREAVSALRLLAGQDPSDRALMALVGELATRSAEFRTWWGGHTRPHPTPPEPNGSTTPSSARSPSPSRPSSSPPAASSSPPTWPSRDPRPQTPSTCSAAGPHSPSTPRADGGEVTHPRRAVLLGAAGAAPTACTDSSGPGRAAASAAPRSQARTAAASSTVRRPAVLLAYFSRAGENYFNGGRRRLTVGNTEVVAGMISRLIGCDVHRIEAADPSGVSTV